MNEHELIQMRNDIAVLMKNDQEILSLLRGPTLDQDNKEKGMVGQVNDHGDRIEKLEDYKTKVNYFFMALTVIISFISAWGLSDIIMKVFR